MKNRLISSLLFLLIIHTWAFSQERCGNALRAGILASYKAKSLVKKPSQARKSSVELIEVPGFIRVPVVFHVIHNTKSGQIGGPSNGNISDEQILSQLKVLNNDYRRKGGTMGFNSDPDGADLQIEFYLATSAPDGRPASGINRIYSEQPSYSVFELARLSELSYWDSNRYLNIWVTKLQDNFIGYGEMPTGEFDGLTKEEIDERVDGVIVDHAVVGYRTGTATKGVYTYGRTLTHEIGHWFGLLHTWGDDFCGTDFVADTPQTESPNATLKCEPKFSNCSGQRTRNMIENYMDYSPDSCMNVFTAGQAERIRNILAVSKRRARFITYNQNLLPFSERFNIKLIDHPQEQGALQVLVPTYQNFSLKLFSPDGRLLAERAYTDSPSRLFLLRELFLQRGRFILVAETDGQRISKQILLL